MIKFSEYLQEKVNRNESDAKGKLFELLHAKHLNNGKMPEHYRDETGKSPEEIHDVLKNSMPSENYHTINAHAKDSAEHVKQHLHDNGYHEHKISRVAWTSQAADHFHETGHHDSNSTADLIISMHHPKTAETKKIGISLKYGKTKDANLKNLGMSSLSAHAGTDLQVHAKNHQKFVRDLGIKSHNDFKKYRDSKDPSMKKVSDSVKQSSVTSRQNMAADYTKDMQAKYNHQSNDLALRDHVKSIVSPDTHLEEIRVHTHTSPDGTTVKNHKIESSSDFHKKLSNYSHLYVGDHSGGTTTTIYGIHKETGKHHPILATSFHGGGKPSIAGAVGINKAPFLGKA